MTRPAANLANIHYTCDTRDACWKAEQDFFDASGPAVSNASVEISRAFLANPHVDDNPPESEMDEISRFLDMIALQARLGFGGIFMILAVFFIIKCWIISINIFRKALLNMDECFTETLEVDNFALAQEANRITNFRIAY